MYQEEGRTNTTSILKLKYLFEVVIRLHICRMFKNVDKIINTIIIVGAGCFDKNIYKILQLQIITVNGQVSLEVPGVLI